MKSIRWDGDHLFFLDQTRLPVEVKEEEQKTVEAVWQSIKQLKVRGAPAIGVAGAYGLVVGMRDHRHGNAESFRTELRRVGDYLNGARPTAVNLGWAIRRATAAVEAAAQDPGMDAEALWHRLKDEAEEIHREDIELCRRIGENGVDLISDGAGVLTHCNAGRLATSDYGTATAPMYLAHQRGVRFTVFSDESRPLLQGSRLTAWELQEAGIEVTTITDSMAAFVMRQGLIDLVIVGTDRVAANGDVANKIGTLGVAILARHFGIPFYVASPASTIDLATATGNEIPIEERDRDEVTHIGDRRTAPEGVAVRNPAFDVTPHELVTAFITDRGVVRPPYQDNLAALFGE